MASAVETQRLITVSLGKIARSRAQRGGINLHKNLLVASVLNKARTAFMMENYSYQLSQQQQQQQKQQQVVLSTPQPAPVCQSPAIDNGNGNSLPTHVSQTCPTTPGVETRSAPLDTHTSSSELVNGSDSCVVPNTTATPSTTTDMIASVEFQSCDKENISPSSNDESSYSTQSYIIPESSEPSTHEPIQQCVSGEQHIEAANQLSHDAQLAGSTSSQNTTSYITLLPCKQQSSATTTCAGVLKRRRDNLEAAQFSCESECSTNKKARVSPDSTSTSSSSSSSSFSQYSQHSDLLASSCEYESDSNCESDMQTSDSPQITNLVSIFNSGFSGLCNMSSSPSSSLEYDNGCYQSDSSSSSSSSSSVSHSHHQSWSTSDNQSLHCSSMVERIGSISSAIVLSA